MTTKIIDCPGCEKVMVATFHGNRRTVICKYCGYKEVRGVVKNKGVKNGK